MFFFTIELKLHDENFPKFERIVTNSPNVLNGARQPFYKSKASFKSYKKSPRVDVFEMFTQIYPELTTDGTEQIAK